eukprot:scaffold3335_cov234-Ochromonas_danica.AAC.6
MRSDRKVRHQISTTRRSAHHLSKFLLKNSGIVADKVAVLKRWWSVIAIVEQKKKKILFI